MKKKTISALLVLTIMFTLFMSIGTTAYGAVKPIDIRIKAQNMSVGNAYYEGEMPIFSVTLENNDATPKEATLTFNVVNDKGVLIQSKARTITLAGNQHKMLGFAPNVENNFGVFTFTAILTTNSGDIEDSIKFSYTKRAESMLDSFGIQCHFSKSGNSKDYANADDSQRILKESGAGWIRDEINWGNVETVKGEYVVPEVYEDSINCAIANGQKVLLLIAGGNKLYETGIGPDGEQNRLCLPVTEEGIEGFVNFVKFVAQHFKGRVDTFEIWNEPDSKTANGHYDWDSDDSAVHYANLIKAVYPAIKSVYEGEEDKVTVISGGCLPVTYDNGYLSKMLSIDGVQDYMDAVAIHPYSGNATYGDMLSGERADLPSQIRRVKSYTDKPIYITEYGASSYAENDGNDGESSFKGYGALGIRGQAIAHVRAYMVAACDPQVEKYFVYNFKEKKETANIESRFGVVDYNYTPKGAYAAISNMADLLGNAEPVTIIDANETSYANGNCARYYEFKDKNNDDEIFVVEAGESQFEGETKLKINKVLAPETGDANAVLDNYNKTLTINGYEGGKVKVIDIMGNEIQFENGEYPLYLEPMYVICSKPHSLQILDGDTVEVKGGGATPFGYVTTVVYKKNLIGKKIAFIEQVKADNSGRYSFCFEKDKGDVYEIRIYDGSAYNNENFGTENYDLDFKYYVNDVELQDVSAIKGGDKVKITMKITDKAKKGTNLIAYGCASYGNTVLFTADRNVTEWINNQAVLTAEVTVPEGGNADSLKFMLWDVNMQPVINKIQSK